MSAAHQPLLDAIEPDDPTSDPLPSGRINSKNAPAREPVVLRPGASSQFASTPGDAESGASLFASRPSHSL
jgi:hypothetical protein